MTVLKIQASGTNNCSKWLKRWPLLCLCRLCCARAGGGGRRPAAG